MAQIFNSSAIKVYMQSAPGSLAIDFSEEFALEMTLGRAHASHVHHAPEDWRRSQYKKDNPGVLHLFHGKNWYDDPLSMVSIRFAHLCKHLVHGGRVPQPGPMLSFVQVKGLDDFLLADTKCRLMFKTWAKKYDKASLDAHFSEAHNMAHQLVRSFLHIHVDNMQAIREAFAMVLMPTDTTDTLRQRKNEAAETIQQQLENVSRDLQSYDIWDRFFLLSLHTNKHLQQTLVNALLKLNHRVIFLQWCSDWKNKRLMLDLQEGPLAQLLYTNKDAAWYWQTDATGLHAELFLQDLSSEHAKNTISMLTEKDCYEIIFQYYFDGHQSEDVIFKHSGKWCECANTSTEESRQQLKQDIQQMHRDWNTAEEHWHRLANDSSYTSKTYPMSQQIDLGMPDNFSQNVAAKHVSSSDNCIPLGVWHQIDDMKEVELAMHGAHAFTMVPGPRHEHWEWIQETEEYQDDNGDWKTRDKRSDKTTKGDKNYKLSQNKKMTQVREKAEREIIMKLKRKMTQLAKTIFEKKPWEEQRAYAYNQYLQNETEIDEDDVEIQAERYKRVHEESEARKKEAKKQEARQTAQSHANQLHQSNLNDNKLFTENERKNQLKDQSIMRSRDASEEEKVEAQVRINNRRQEAFEKAKKFVDDYNKVMTDAHYADVSAEKWIKAVYDQAEASAILNKQQTEDEAAFNQRLKKEEETIKKTKNVK